MVPDGSYQFVVDWGDGTKSKIDNYSSASKTHIYEQPGKYTLKITGWAFNGNEDSIKLIEINQWGPFSFGPGNISNGAFDGCKNLEITAEDIPDLTGTTSLERVFRGCEKAVVKNIGSWDTSKITNMKQMFAGAKMFHSELSSWDTLNVTNMSGMFYAATAFNQDISSWDTSNVEYMNYMFNGASKFNKNLGS